MVSWQHVHLRPVREAFAQHGDDLLRTPVHHQPVLDDTSQLVVGGESAWPGVGPARIGAGLGGVRAVLAVGRVPVPADFPADRRGAAVQLSGDGAQGYAFTEPVGDVDPLVRAEEPPRRRRSGRHLDWWRPDMAAGRVGPVPPSLTGAVVNADDPASRLTAVPQLHEPEVFRPLLPQRPTPLRRSVLALLEGHRTSLSRGVATTARTQDFRGWGGFRCGARIDAQASAPGTVAFQEPHLLLM
jgi:hypothetical protein